MKKEIKQKLIDLFKKKFGHSPEDKELKKLDYLAFIYERDMKYILKLEMNDFEIREERIKEES